MPRGCRQYNRAAGSFARHPPAVFLRKAQWLGYRRRQGHGWCSPLECLVGAVPLSGMALAHTVLLTHQASEPGVTVGFPLFVYLCTPLSPLSPMPHRRDRADRADRGGTQFSTKHVEVCGVTLFWRACTWEQKVHATLSGVPCSRRRERTHVRLFNAMQNKSLHATCR